MEQRQEEVGGLTLAPCRGEVFAASETRAGASWMQMTVAFVCSLRLAARGFPWQ